MVLAIPGWQFLAGCVAYVLLVRLLTPQAKHLPVNVRRVGMYSTNYAADPRGRSKK